MSLDIVHVPLRILEAFREDIVPLIQKALDTQPPKYTGDDIFEQALRSELDVFVVIDQNVKIQAAATVRIDQYPLAKVICIQQLGSYVPFEELDPLFEKMREWAVMNECDYAEIYGRKGWLKLLTRFKVAGSHLVSYL